MKIGLEPAAENRIGDLISAIDRFTAAIEANTAAIESRNAVVDCQLNGPRG